MHRYIVTDLGFPVPAFACVPEAYREKFRQLQLPSSWQLQNFHSTHPASTSKLKGPWAKGIVARMVKHTRDPSCPTQMLGASAYPEKLSTFRKKVFQCAHSIISSIHFDLMVHYISWHFAVAREI
jgi:hypothetical protein